MVCWSTAATAEGEAPHLARLVALNHSGGTIATSFNSGSVNPTYQRRFNGWLSVPAEIRTFHRPAHRSILSTCALTSSSPTSLRKKARAALATASFSCTSWQWVELDAALVALVALVALAVLPSSDSQPTASRHSTKSRPLGLRFMALSVSGQKRTVASAAHRVGSNVWQQADIRRCMTKPDPHVPCAARLSGLRVRPRPCAALHGNRTRPRA